MNSQIIPFPVDRCNAVRAASGGGVDVTATAKTWGFRQRVVVQRDAFAHACGMPSVSEEAWLVYDLTRAAWFSWTAAGGNPAFFDYGGSALRVMTVIDAGEHIVQIGFQPN